MAKIQSLSQGILQFDSKQFSWILDTCLAGCNKCIYKHCTTLEIFFFLSITFERVVYVLKIWTSPKMPGAKHLIPDPSAISSATKEPYLLHISPGAAMLQTG